MDTAAYESSSPVQIKNEHQSEINDKDSVEQFQQFIFELFEKNGILSDLRAYLRKNIVTVLKNAYSGDTPACQKHFAQRLELASQACNMLIADYLLCYEFSYTSSVFLSEIPLANMAFNFARDLLKSTPENNVRLKEKDICSIINYLGIHCNANYVSEVIDMYKSEPHTPLLLSILKCHQLIKPEAVLEQASDDQQDLNNLSSTDTLSEIKKQDYCPHTSTCYTCSTKISKLRRKCKKNKKTFVKLFKQLRSVYEAEVESLRAEEEDKINRTLADHVLKLQKEKYLMEEQFKVREQELERSMQEKKKFLWGLARSLRDQHDQMARAMQAVRYQAQKLSTKENSLRSQLIEAEEKLRKRGEGLQQEISSELVLLEESFVKMRSERDSLHQERSRLEQMRCPCSGSNSGSKLLPSTSDPPSNYDIISREITQLKKYIDVTKFEPKSLKDRGTLTILNGVTAKLTSEMLNNEQIVQSREEDKLKDQVVNDFKKLKNINFCMGKISPVNPVMSRAITEPIPRFDAELPRRANGDHALRDLGRFHPQPMPPPPVVADERLIVQEPETRPNIRPRTAPPVATNIYQQYGLGLLSEGAPFVCRSGGGETQLQAPCRGTKDPAIPPDRHVDIRRHLIHQWRLSRHLSPRARRARARHDAHLSYRQLRRADNLPTNNKIRIDTPIPLQSSPPSSVHQEVLRDSPTELNCNTTVFTAIVKKSPRPRRDLPDTRHREKSPKSMLREAKEKLRTKSNTKSEPTTSKREKSPNAVLREAKLRLRKLEIEAEAVERSYLDFRKRQNELRIQPVQEEAIVTRDVGDLAIRSSRSLHKLDTISKQAVKADTIQTHELIREDFDKYLREYHAKFDLSETYFSNRNTKAATANPIPKSYSPYTVNEDKHNINTENHIDAPLEEFRKQYQVKPGTVKTIPDIDIESGSSKTNENDGLITPKEKKPYTLKLPAKTTFIDDMVTKTEALFKENKRKQKELAILKSNLNKMYNEDKNPHKVQSPRSLEKDSLEKPLKITEENLLTIEIENVNKENVMRVVKTEPENLLVVVQSNIDAAASISATDTEHDQKICTNMTILISPKKSDTSNNPKSPEPKRTSPEQAAKLTRNDVLEAIYHVEAKVNSNIDVHEYSSKDPIDESTSEVDYVDDDFTADVDNYNTFPEIQSPISIPKSAEKTFWDS